MMDSDTHCNCEQALVYRRELDKWIVTLKERHSTCSTLYAFKPSPSMQGRLMELEDLARSVGLKLKWMFPHEGE